jgi:hypothetical protein
VAAPECPDELIHAGRQSVQIRNTAKLDRNRRGGRDVTTTAQILPYAGASHEHAEGGGNQHGTPMGTI